MRLFGGSAARIKEDEGRESDSERPRRAGFIKETVDPPCVFANPLMFAPLGYHTEMFQKGALH